MAYRRIAYAALLGGAVLFQIVFRFYLSTFTLALVLLLPLLSVLLSLPSVLGCTLLLTSAAPTVVQGEDAVFQVRLRSRTRLPLPRLQARLHWSNQLTGAGGRVRWEPVRTAPGAPPTLELATPHCGRLICRAERAWTCDLLGLFPLPIPTGRPAAVLILTGSSVAIAGPISFVGLVVPHGVRFLAGADYRKVIPCSVLGGALLVVAADIISRLIHPPFETPAGAVTALIGVPFFIWLASGKGGRK